MDLEAINRKANEVLAKCIQVTQPVSPPCSLEIGNQTISVPVHCECGRPVVAVVEYVLDGVAMFWRVTCEDHAKPSEAQVTVSFS